MPALERFIRLPARGAPRGVILQYGYSPGASVQYHLNVSIHREREGVPEPTSAQHEVLEASLRLSCVDVNADNSVHLLVEHEPLSHYVDGEYIFPPGRSTFEFHQTSFGEPVGSPFRSDVVNLILPRMAVWVDSTWAEVERFVPPRYEAMVERVRTFRVTEINDALIHISFDSPPVIYHTQDEWSAYALNQKGSYVFDSTYGVVLEQHIEASMLGREGDMLYEVQTTYDLTVHDEE